MLHGLQQGHDLVAVQRFVFRAALQQGQQRVQVSVGVVEVHGAAGDAFVHVQVVPVQLLAQCFQFRLALGADAQRCQQVLQLLQDGGVAGASGDGLGQGARIGIGLADIKYIHYGLHKHLLKEACAARTGGVGRRMTKWEDRHINGSPGGLNAMRPPGCG